ncbi:MAG: aspartate aminotransferase family protein [Actinobacteria bacterium]|nr:aspartate aminotransferase family protein [Actinomycetota bacterium]
MGDGDLDAAVGRLAELLRAALDPPSRAGVDLDAAGVRALVDAPLPEKSLPLEDVLDELARRTGPGLAGTAGGRYLGYVTGGVLPSAAIAQAWAGAVDQNPGLWALGPAATAVEQLVLRWLGELLELPHRSAVITSGGAGANLVCLAVARQAVGRMLGVDVGADGVAALPPFAVYGSAEMHFTNVKALRTLGLGTRCLRSLPVGADYRLDPAVLEAAIEQDLAEGVVPGIVVAAAGSPTTGAVDPLREIADVCARHGAWLHVDAAFGAFLRLAPRLRALVDGIELADSVTVDGHKWLNLPTGTGFAYVGDPELHRETFTGTAGYLTRQAGAGDDLHELGVEASRPWRGAAAWAALRHLGREGVVDLVTRCCDLAQGLGRLVEETPELDLVAPVASCVVCFRYRPVGTEEGEALDALNRAIQQRLAQEGVLLATGGMLPSGFCLRPAIVHWRTTADDLALLAREVVRLGDLQ